RAPASPDKNALRVAVGALPAATGERAATPGDAEDAADHEGEPQRPRGSRAPLLIATLAIAAVGAGAFAVVGYLNSDRYVLACEPERAVPEQGRGFPPWGTRALAGAQWRPLKIAPETRCQARDTDDPLVLERAFLAMVLDQASALLTAHEVTRIDDAEALLQQALLLTRPAEHEAEPLAHQRGEQHDEIDRLLGDVAYWRGQAKVRDALSALGEAAKQFDAAVARHPRHAADAGTWATRVRTLADQIHASSPAPSTGPPASAGPSTGSAPSTGAASSVPGPAASTSPSAGAGSSSGATPAATAPSPALSAGSGSAGHPDVPAHPGDPERPPQPPLPPSSGTPAGGVLL
ncbi:MAG TPA: hypothetical protein VHW23_34115, partial [Kofleriaceae bacterium]|nr:hypothetical protein [Kofleriaceae bacterium]